MPVFREEVEQGPKAAVDKVRVKVTRRGHGKISTGKHSARNGEEYFAEGEEFDMVCELAEALASDAGDRPRMYVSIVGPPRMGPVVKAVKAA